MKREWAQKLRVFVAPAMVMVAMLTAGGTRADDTAPAGRTTAYVLTNFYWAIHQTPDAKTECPQGLNNYGPREQFRVMWPDNGKKYTVADTHLVFESQIFFPKAGPEPFEFREAQGKVSYGLNLDGKIGPNDFVSPEGEPGIDNNLFRVIGCIINYRGPDGFLYVFTNQYLEGYVFNRLFFELTNVDSLVNDDDVDITIYRGTKPLIKDATGQDFLPGGTQSPELRWGKKLIRHTKGKIVNGVLTTAPIDVIMPMAAVWEEASVMSIRGMRLKVKLTADHAEGLLAGYPEVDSFYDNMIKTWSTHHLSYGQQSQPSVYRALRRLADGYPDPTTGENTAISAAAEVKFAQVFVLHPEKAMAGEVAPASTSTSAARSSGR